MSARSASHALNLQSVADAALPPRPRVLRPIVILGAGGIVRAAHLPAYAKAGFPVLAAADRDAARAEALARDFALPRSFGSAAEAIRFAPPDAVFDLAVPAAGLLDVLRLLPRRSAVLMQKPMGETLEEARAIRDLCRDRELTAAVNFQLRFAPAHLAAQALARAGVLGTLHDIEVQVRTYTPWHLWSFLATAPRLEILYHSIHYLDIVRAWLGDPQGVYAKTVRHPLYAQLAPTKSAVILDYGDRARVTVLTNHGHDLARTSQHSFVQLEGTEGAIRVGLGVNLNYPAGEPDTLAVVQRTAADAGWQTVVPYGNWFPDAFIGSMASLQAFVAGDAAELPTAVESAFATMATVEAAYRSSERGGEPLPL